MYTKGGQQQKWSYVICLTVSWSSDTRVVDCIITTATVTTTTTTTTTTSTTTTNPWSNDAEVGDHVWQHKVSKKLIVKTCADEIRWLWRFHHRATHIITRQNLHTNIWSQVYGLALRRESNSELRSITHHIKSHPTWVNTPCLSPNRKVVTQFFFIFYV